MWRENLRLCLAGLQRGCINVIRYRAARGVTSRHLLLRCLLNFHNMIGEFIILINLTNSLKPRVDNKNQKKDYKIKVHNFHIWNLRWEKMYDWQTVGLDVLLRNDVGGRLPQSYGGNILRTINFKIENSERNFRWERCFQQHFE